MPIRTLEDGKLELVVLSRAKPDVESDILSKKKEIYGYVCHCNIQSKSEHSGFESAMYNLTHQDKTETDPMKIVTAIDNADVAINSNITDIQMARRFNPDSNNVSGLYDLYYHNPIKPGTIISSSIIKTGGDTYALMDDGLGVMTLYNITQEAFTSINIGTIDYTKGIIYLRNFNIDIDTTQMISIYAVPSNTDVKSSQNVLILFDVANITTDTI